MFIDCKYLFLFLFLVKDEFDGVKFKIILVIIFVEVIEGIVVKFFCRVFGLLKLIVIWLKEGENVVLDLCVISDINEDVFLFYFKEIVLDDEGEYECKV